MWELEPKLFKKSKNKSNPPKLKCITYKPSVTAGWLVRGVNAQADTRNRNNLMKGEQFIFGWANNMNEKQKETRTQKH